MFVVRQRQPPCLQGLGISLFIKMLSFQKVGNRQRIMYTAYNSTVNPFPSLKTALRNCAENDNGHGQRQCSDIRNSWCLLTQQLCYRRITAYSAYCRILKNNILPLTNRDKLWQGVTTRDKKSRRHQHSCKIIHTVNSSNANKTALGCRNTFSLPQMRFLFTLMQWRSLPPAYVWLFQDHIREAAKRFFLKCWVWPLCPPSPRPICNNGKAPFVFCCPE